jgi:hypothetical protein
MDIYTLMHGLNAFLLALLASGLLDLALLRFATRLH